jgi:sirohydrochlorin cobaltochelatase
MNLEDHQAEDRSAEDHASVNQAALETLEFRVRAILPEQYQDCYDDVKPVSMGSAGLKFGEDGKVAWDKMWGSFCDLAMAGGPPHKGTLLEPASQASIDAEPDRYTNVVEEICRGVSMVTNLVAEASVHPGWISVDCVNRGTAAWLLRAITVENVSARCEGAVLYLPAGPSYRLENEIKNVITVIAKTSHYWFEHTSLAQRRNIGNLFVAMEAESPLLQPAFLNSNFQSDSHQAIRRNMVESLGRLTRLQVSNHVYADWLGIEHPHVPSAIWMMRALVASNILSRREGTVVFVPLDPLRDPNGSIVVQRLQHLHSLARVRDVL